MLTGKENVLDIYNYKCLGLQLTPFLLFLRNADKYLFKSLL